MTSGSTSSGAGNLLTRLVIGVIKRVYAIGVILVVAWLSYEAFAYLIVTLLMPANVPPAIEQVPVRLDKSVLLAEPQTFAGVTAAEEPRTPLAHYHQLDGWFQPDRVNDCTRSGCHVPLPHNRDKATRAFLNMHATSVHCGVCHLESDQTPRPLVWYDIHTGRASEPPALLRAYAWLISDEGRAALEAAADGSAQQRLVTLLETATRQAGGDPAIQRLADLVAGPRYSSARFQDAVAQVRLQIPMHFRGEYGAKLALMDGAGRPRLGHRGGEEATEAFLDRGDNLEPAAREELLERLHSERRPTTLHCTDCHRAGKSLVDLGAVGYPPRRIKALQESWVFRAIEHIAEGQPLHMPSFVVPGAEGENNATQPAD